ncbi:MAG: DNA primase, partial [Bacteroidales bacterium]|nr:DNA primase [Bacteroidales bacterium]
KTPSFNVNPAKNIFKCFGCGKGGDAVTFLMEHEHFSYPEALRYLAKKYGIPIQEEEQTPEMIQQMNEREGLFNVTEFAKNQFGDLLHHNDSGRSIGLSYFRERGFSPTIIEKFQLGYCLDEWDSFTKTAIAKGYNADYLVKTGLSIRRDDGTMYDRFKGRVMFPIHNLSGRTIAFGGRTLITDKAKAAKYVNSPESDIYSKSKVLYGLHFSKTAIVQQDTCLLVEGYTDVISLHQAGVENVVASSGTSLTTEQIKLISRYTKNIVMLYDGDAAGIKASFRGMDMILQEGLNVRIVLFPDGEDPDSFARSHSSTDVQKFIADHAVDFIRFKANILLKEANGDPIKKTALLKDVVSSIALIPDEISRTIYTTECSRILDFPESILISEINKILRANFKKKHNESAENIEAIAPPDVPITPTEQTIEGDANKEREIIRILVNYHHAEIPVVTDEESGETQRINVAKHIFEDISNDELTFDNPLYNLIFQAFSNSKNPVDDAFFCHHENEQVKQLASDLMNSPHNISKNWKEKGIAIKEESEEDKLSQLVSDCLLTFKLCKVEKEKAKLSEQLKTEKSDENIQILLVQLAKYERVRVQISNLLGRVVTR